MNAKDFFMLVVKMRHFQREYFATRSKESLEQAKKVERQIDDEIERVKRLGVIC